MQEPLKRSFQANWTLKRKKWGDLARGEDSGGGVYSSNFTVEKKKEKREVSEKRPQNRSEKVGRVSPAPITWGG